MSGREFIRHRAAALDSKRAPADIRADFLRPDVAVVSVRQRPVTLADAPLEGVPEGRPTYVLTHEGDDWLIAAAQNTQVKDA